MARLAKVRGRRDRDTFSLAFTCHFVSIFPRVFEYAVCLLLVPFVFPVARSQHRETGCGNMLFTVTLAIVGSSSVCALSDLCFMCVTASVWFKIARKTSHTFMVAELSL